MTDFVLIGNLAETPIVETAKNGSKFVKLKVESSNGRSDESVDLFEVYAWNNLAEETYSKGQKLFIKGRLTSNNNEKETVVYYNTRLLAERIDFNV